MSCPGCVLHIPACGGEATGTRQTSATQQFHAVHGALTGSARNLRLLATAVAAEARTDQARAEQEQRGRFGDGGDLAGVLHTQVQRERERAFRTI